MIKKLRNILVVGFVLVAVMVVSESALATEFPLGKEIHRVKVNGPSELTQYPLGKPRQLPVEWIEGYRSYYPYGYDSALVGQKMADGMLYPLGPGCYCMN